MSVVNADDGVNHLGETESNDFMKAFKRRKKGGCGTGYRELCSQDDYSIGRENKA